MSNSIRNKYAILPVQVKASFWFLICSFLQKGISSMTTPIFTRLLDTAEYGKYNVFNSWLGIVTIFVSLNLSAGVYVQGLVKFDKEQPIFSSSLQGLTFVLTVTWTVVYLAFHNFWNGFFSLTTVQMLAMLLMIWTTAVFSFWAAEQRVKLSYAKLVLITLIVSLAKPIVGIFFVLNAEDKVTARILGLALVELVGYSGLFIIQMVHGKKFFSSKYWKYALLFNLPLVPHYLSQTVLNSADRIMIDRIAGAAEAGIYGLAYSVSMIMTLFGNALGQTISPWRYQKIKSGTARDIAPITYISLLFVATVNVLLIILAPEIISIFAPKSYYDAIWVIPPVAMSVYYMFAYDCFAAFEFYYEKTNYIMIASIASAILNIVLNRVFIPIFGYIAAGYTTLLCYFLYTLGHYIFMKHVIRRYMNNEKIYDARILIVISLIFTMTGFVITFTYNYVCIRYALVIALCTAIIIWRKTIFRYLKPVLSKKNEG